MGSIDKSALKRLDDRIFRLAMRSSTADNSHDYQEMKEMLKEVRIAFNEIDNYENENENEKERNRGVIMDCLKRYKTGDGGADTWGPCCPRETFYVHESDFEKVADMIISQIGSL